MGGPGAYRRKGWGNGHGYLAIRRGRCTGRNAAGHPLRKDPPRQEAADGLSAGSLAKGPAMSITVLLVDDQRIIREGLHICLEREDGIGVIGEAENGRDAVRLARELKPDVVVMDITMPDLNGIEATRQILHHVHGTKVLALSVHADRRYVAEMLRAGASGYLLKDCAFGELTRAIQAIASGEVYLSPRISQTVVEDYVHGSRQGGKEHVGDLSSREREVLQLLAEGSGTKEAARRLHLSPKTVETHRHHLMEKLRMHSVAELTRYAIREGLTPLDD